MVAYAKTWFITADDGIGKSQAWQNVKAERASNVTYWNQTGKPIQVSAGGTSASSGGTSTAISAYVDEVLVGKAVDYSVSPGYGATLSFTVPPCSAYRIVFAGGTGGTNIHFWAELR